MASSKTISKQQANEVLWRMLAFSRAAHQILDERAIEIAGEPLSTSRVQILRLLEMRGQQSPTQIAEFLGVTRAAVTRLVTTLVSQNLVRRRELDGDRRSFVLELTKEGSKAIEAVHEEQRHLVRSALHHSENADPEAWANLLEAMTAALAQTEETFQKFCQRCGGFSGGSCVLTGGDAKCLFLKSQEGG